MLQYPALFDMLKWLGGAYLVVIGIKMWLAEDSIASIEKKHTQISNMGLLSQGFVTAVANPKGWAFMVSLLPPFINTQQALLPQLSLLVMIILTSEFISMMAYAYGGKTLNQLLQGGDKVKFLNRIAGSLMIAVGIWMALG